MKILFFIDGLRAGGKERRLVELIRALTSNQEIDCELVIMNEEIHYKEVLDTNISIHSLIRGTKKDVTIFQKFYRLCKTTKPDIVHCWDNMTAIYSVPACKLLNIPLINGMITNSPQKWLILNKYWLRAKLTFPFSDYIVSNSKSGMIAYGVSKKNSYIIHNGFDFNRIIDITHRDMVRSQMAIKTKFVVGMVATFSKSKDYGTYFKAAQLLLEQRKDITFLAIGHKTDSIILRSMIEGKNMQYFRFLGTKSDIESYINAMDICVLSTFTEGISNSILEYMALAKPVVATDGGGTNEIVENMKTGFLVKVSDPEDLSGKINMLLQDETLRMSMGANGKKRIQEAFSMEKMLNEYISLYNKIIKAKRNN